MNELNKIQINYNRLVVAKHPSGYWEVFYIQHGTLWAIPVPRVCEKYNQIKDYLNKEVKEESIVNATGWSEVQSIETLQRAFYRGSNGLHIPTNELEKELTEFRTASQVGKALKPADNVQQEDPGAGMATKFPKYWKDLPALWKAIDTYRVNQLFPIHGDDSGRLIHARKKLLVPGTRTGGKSLYIDIREAHATLGAWLADNAPESK